MEVSKPLILHIEVGSSHATCRNRLNILIETVSIQRANYTKYEDSQLQLHLSAEFSIQIHVTRNTN